MAARASRVGDRCERSSPSGLSVGVTLLGSMHDPTLTPPLEAMLDPEFEFADVDMSLHGAAWCQTMAPQYAFVNHTVYSSTGTRNVARGEVRVSAYVNRS